MIQALSRLWSARRTRVADLIIRHFKPLSIDELAIGSRRFPYRVRADLQRATDRLFTAETAIVHFTGVHKDYAHEGIDFANILGEVHMPALAMPPEYEDVNVGDPEPVRCLQVGLWLLRTADIHYAVLLSPDMKYGRNLGIRFQIATPNSEAGTRITQQFFRHLEESVLRAESYRGKILSLEEDEHYTGQATGIRVHKLRAVAREQVILPRRTLDLLDRNVIRFVEQRPRLAALRQSTKKGVLFYGPPGTGKTHTIHYLAGALKGHTTLIISAEQVGLLSEYMTLARLLQPSMVVIEDVDLVARDRERRSGPCDEALLNKLLNEMDGLKEDADILFILTTNRPENLEAALASRPGRVDQAIEFPLPDDEGREKLVRLYARGNAMPDELLNEVVKRTERVSGAFIKELMRRAFQFHVERGGDGDGGGDGLMTLSDVENALDEMLVSGGALNMKLLGAER